MRWSSVVALISASVVFIALQTASADISVREINLSHTFSANDASCSVSPSTKLKSPLFALCILNKRHQISMGYVTLQVQFGNVDNWRQLGGGPQHYGISPNTVPKGNKLKFLSGGLPAFVETWGFIKSSSDVFYLAANWNQPGGEPLQIVTAMKKDGVYHLWRNVVGQGFGRLFAPALSNDEKLLYYVTTNTIFAYDATTGRQVWNASSPTGSPVVGSNGNVYVVGESYNKNFCAFDGATGRLLWSSDFSMVGTKFWPCALDEKETMCVTAQYDSIRKDDLYVIALSLSGGKLLWQTPISPGPVFHENRFVAWPLVRNGIAWVPLSNSEMMLIDTTTGKSILNGIANYTGITAPFGLAGGPVIFSMSNSMYKPTVYDLCLAQNSSSKFIHICIDKLNATINGRVTPVGMISPSVITKDLVAIFFIGDHEAGQGYLVGYDLQKRVRLWMSPQSIYSYHSPVVAADGTIWIMTADGNIMSWIPTN